MNYFYLLIARLTLFLLLLLTGSMRAMADTPSDAHAQTITHITQTIGQGFAELNKGQYEQATTTATAAGQTAQQALAALPTAPDDPAQAKMRAELNLGQALAYQLQGQIDWRQGLALQFQSEHAKAEPLLRNGLELAQKSLALTQDNAAQAGIKVGKAPFLVSGQMLALAASYQLQGRHNEASVLLEQCRQLLGTMPGQLEDTWASLTSLADLYRKQGNPAQAETLLKSIIDGGLPPAHPGIATALTYLGQLYQSEGKYQEAEQCYQQSIEKSPDKARAALPLASLYEAQAHYDKAEPLLTAALAEMTQPPAQDSTQTEQQLDATVLAGILDMQGRVNTALGNYSAARTSFQQNLANNLLAPASPGSKANGLAGLAKVDGLQKDIPAALHLIQQAWEEYAAHPGADREQASGQRQLARLHLWLLQRGLAWQQANADTALPEAFIAMQQAHGDERTAALRQTALRLTANAPEIRDALQHLWQQQNHLQRLDTQYAESLADTASSRHTTLDDLQQAMQQTSQTIRQLDQELQTRFPAYASLLNPTPLTLAKAQSLLQADEALLTWVLGEGNNNDHSWLLVLRPDKPPKLYALDVNPSVLQASLNDPASGLLGAMGNPQQPFNLNTAHALYQRLLAPAADDLVGVKHILAVPDGVLLNLPLHLLVKSKPEASPPNQHGDYAHADWLARHYAISYLPSVHALADLRTHPAPVQDDAAQPFMGFGNPVLTGSNADLPDLFQQLGNHLQHGSDGLDFLRTTSLLAQYLQPLPDTATELAKIASLLHSEPDKTLFLGKDANETHLKQLSQSGQLRHGRILSFATHALLPPTNQGNPLLERLEPGLVLTPPAQGSANDDGYLTASEISGLELNADWVLLSACNTGTLTPQDTANGLSALSKAFFAAGAHSVLASHWAVDSKATTQLMTQLFAALQQEPHPRKAEALRRAMLEALATPAECGLLCWLGWQDAPQPAHPAYWAAFTMYGE